MQWQARAIRAARASLKLDGLPVASTCVLRARFNLFTAILISDRRHSLKLPAPSDLRGSTWLGGPGAGGEPAPHRGAQESTIALWLDSSTPRSH